jgi:hypothetical protein
MKAFPGGWQGEVAPADIVVLATAWPEISVLEGIRPDGQDILQCAPHVQARSIHDC